MLFQVIGIVNFNLKMSIIISIKYISIDFFFFFNIILFLLGIHIYDYIKRYKRYHDCQNMVVFHGHVIVEILKISEY